MTYRSLTFGIYLAGSERIAAGTRKRRVASVAAWVLIGVRASVR